MNVLWTSWWHVFSNRLEICLDSKLSQLKQNIITLIICDEKSIICLNLVANCVSSKTFIVCLLIRIVYHLPHCNSGLAETLIKRIKISKISWFLIEPPAILLSWNLYWLHIYAYIVFIFTFLTQRAFDIYYFYISLSTFQPCVLKFPLQPHRQSV